VTAKRVWDPGKDSNNEAETGDIDEGISASKTNDKSKSFARELEDLG